MKSSIIALSIAMLTATGALAQDASGTAAGGFNAEQQDQFGEILLAQARTEAQVIAALELQGYEVSDTRRSLLGRVIITAQNDVHVREVVMSRATGEILSDQIIATLDGQTAIAADSEAGTQSENSSDGGASVDVTGDLGINLNLSSDRDDDDEAGNNDRSGISVGGSGGGGISLGLGN